MARWYLDHRKVGGGDKGQGESKYGDKKQWKYVFKIGIQSLGYYIHCSQMKKIR